MDNIELIVGDEEDEEGEGLDRFKERFVMSTTSTSAGGDSSAVDEKMKIEADFIEKNPKINPKINQNPEP